MLVRCGSDGLACSCPTRGRPSRWGLTRLRRQAAPARLHSWQQRQSFGAVLSRHALTPSSSGPHHDPAPVAPPPSPRHPPLLLRVPDVCEQLGLSRAAVQRLLTAGTVPSVTVGRSRRVRYSDLQQYVESLTAAGQPTTWHRQDQR